MPALLLLAFVVVPLVEVAVLLQVGQLIGTLPAVGLLLAVSVLGAWLARREGTRAWRALRDALAQGRAPGREVADGALVLVGATLLLTPGFVTDAVGALLLVPVTRAVARRLLLRTALRASPLGPVASVLVPGLGRARARRRQRPDAADRTAPAAGGPAGRGGSSRAAGRPGDGRVVDGEVVDPDDGPAAGSPPHPA